MPSCKELVKIVLGPEAASKISKVPLSAYTISHQVSDISSDTEVILWEKINVSKKFSLQINKSTGISGLAQLIANIRYNDGDIITRNFFFCKELQSKQLVMRYFMFLTNIFAKMDCSGRTVLVSAQMVCQ
jgi:hypothetical protein